MERFSSFDGTAIAFGTAGDTTGRRAVLLHHGFASTSEINWVRPGLVDALARSGCRVVFIDARGHGESDRPHDPVSYANGAMARDVRALIDHLGLEEVDMAGYSMGSFVTLAVAANEPRLRSMFLGGAGTGQLRTGWREIANAIAEALETDDPTTITDPSAKAFRNFAEATGQDRLALAAIQRSGGGLGPDSVSSLNLPTLVVNGERDTLIGDPGSLAALIEGARSLVVPGDHISAVVQPEFRDALVSWAMS
ncbi:MAG: alpha/beta fold hydrolase [Acidimicrobiales bacterium]|jgi:pimeloyl-ACP methyl ester carboxylesterase